MRIPDKEKFQPSDEALQAWLATRKREFRVSGRPAKPLFSDTGNSNDSTWFWVAVVLEILGLLATIWGGMRSGVTFLIIASFIVFAIILLDLFFLSNRLHRNVGKTNWISALIPTIPEDDHQEIAKLESIKNTPKEKMINYLIIFALFLFAIVKTLAILLLGTFSSPIIYFVFFALFLLVVYIHINHTGYYQAYRKTEKLIDRDYKYYAQNTNENRFVAKESPYKFEVSSKLVLPIEYNGHRIVINEDAPKDDGMFHYKLISKGVLTDDELVKLSANQEKENKYLIFEFGRKHQLENFNVGYNIQNKD